MFKRRSSRITKTQVKDLEAKLATANGRCKQLEISVDGLRKEAEQAKNALLSSLKGVLATSLIESHVWDEIDELFAKRTFCQPLSILIEDQTKETEPIHEPKVTRDPSFHLQLDDVITPRDSISSRPSAVNIDDLKDTLRSNISITPPGTVPDKKTLARASEKVLTLSNPDEGQTRRRLLDRKPLMSAAAMSPKAPDGKAMSPELRVVTRKPSSSPTGTERKATDESNLEKPSSNEKCSVADEEADKKLSTSPQDQLVLTSKFDPNNMSTKSIIIHNEHGSSRSLASRDRKISNTSSTGTGVTTSPSVKDINTRSRNGSLPGQLSSGPSCIDLGQKTMTSRSGTSVIALDGERSTIRSPPGNAVGNKRSSGGSLKSARSSKEKLKSPSSPMDLLQHGFLTISETNEVEAEEFDLGDLPLSPFKADNSSMFAPMFSEPGPSTSKKKKVSFGGPHTRADTWAPDASPLQSPLKPMFSPTVSQPSEGADSDEDSDGGGFGGGFGGSLFERLETARIAATASIQNDRGLQSSIKRAHTARKITQNMRLKTERSEGPKGKKKKKKTRLGSSLTVDFTDSGRKSPVSSAPNRSKTLRMARDVKSKSSSFSSRSKTAAQRKAARKPRKTGGKVERESLTKPKPPPRANSYSTGDEPKKKATSLKRDPQLSKRGKGTQRKTAAEAKMERDSKRKARLAVAKTGHTRSKSAQSWSPYG